MGSTITQSDKPKYFYACTENGGWIVAEHLVSLNWIQITDKNDAKSKWPSPLTFYWTQLKNKTLSMSFVQGKSHLYQIPNNNLLTTKIGLLQSLRAYDRYIQTQNVKVSWHMNYKSFFPESYRLDIRDERIKFFEN